MTMLLSTFTVLHHEWQTKSIALFSPHDKPEARLVGLIKKTQNSLCAAVYTITNKRITDALIAAHKRGVKITIITDYSSLETPAGKIDALKNAGIDVVVFKPRTSSLRYRPLMHNKFAIFDCNEKERWVWTGSFNWTRSANISNHENVILSSNKKLFERYSHHFEKLKNECSSMPKRKIATKKTADASTVGKIKSLLYEIRDQFKQRYNQKT